MRRGSKSTSARYGAGFWGLLNGGQVFKISISRFYPFPIPASRCFYFPMSSLASPGKDGSIRRLP